MPKTKPSYKAQQAMRRRTKVPFTTPAIPPKGGWPEKPPAPRKVKPPAARKPPAGVRTQGPITLPARKPWPARVAPAKPAAWEALERKPAPATAAQKEQMREIVAKAKAKLRRK